MNQIALNGARAIALASTALEKASFEAAGLLWFLEEQEHGSPRLFVLNSSDRHIKEIEVKYVTTRESDGAIYSKDKLFCRDIDINEKRFLGYLSCQDDAWLLVKSIHIVYADSADPVIVEPGPDAVIRPQPKPVS